MARAGTLPSYLHQREVQPGESVSLEHSISREQQGSQVNETEDEDGILEHDSSRSEEDSEEGSLPEADDDIGSLGREANFLLGTVSRFGRTIRFNNTNMTTTPLSFGSVVGSF